jgi:phage replication O-like protein O
MGEEMSEFKPNTTQYPNFLFDLMPSLKEGELRLLNAIVRKTYGWQKQRDKISLSQMIELTGMSKQGILDARERLINKGIIKAEMVNGIMEYMVVIPEELPVNKVDLNKREAVKIEHEASLNQPEMDVHNVDTQKKELQKKITKEREEEPTPKKQDDLNPFAKTNLVEALIDDYLRKNYRTKIHSDKLSCKEIADRILDDEDVEEFMTELFMRWESSWWKDKLSPQPRQIVKAWDQLMVIEIPEWKKSGFGSEYEYNIRNKAKPSHHTTMEQLQTYQEPKADPEQINNFLNDLETLKT